ncbi:methyltransferase domain-containing protein [Amycolatopsis magusensis]|uniref:Protein-L-isoaspartate O-methyltransferase n=1 Tax=Amycolatopsis magusensis TaxID=882444 RepID=A0ABS4PWM0_9PSEU|nr:methyltransferase domain-containing protein [Amycolatopsis magusensis]MBP2183831.1 protein-L-isoaspartate O-methyltransferase [Amycolatopsis magusensis]
MTVPDTAQGVSALREELSSAGLLPAEFGPLLEALPREYFVPDQIWVSRRPIDRRTDLAGWREAVYANRSLVTQYDDGRTHWPEVGDLPTCSASQPSVVLNMLKELDLSAGHTVLEIGTGTGLNAALIAELVGPTGQVTTMEVDRRIAEHAERRLQAAEVANVTVIPRDATFGWDDHAPFDRVIATAAVPLGRVPYAWIEQTRAGGHVIVPIRTPLTAGPLVRFTVHGDGTATGVRLPMGVAFMESRSHRSPQPPATLPDWEQDGTDESVTTTVPWPLLGTPSSRWALAVALGSCRYEIEPSSDARPYKLAWLLDPLSGSWASVVPLGEGKYRVRQSGPRRLWDEAEAVRRWYVDHGEPAITSWTWTITPESQSISPRTA